MKYHVHPNDTVIPKSTRTTEKCSGETLGPLEETKCKDFSFLRKQSLRRNPKTVRQVTCVDPDGHDISAIELFWMEHPTEVMQRWGGGLIWSQTGVWLEQEIFGDFHLNVGGWWWNLFNINLMILQKECFLNLNMKLEVGTEQQ